MKRIFIFIIFILFSCLTTKEVKLKNTPPLDIVIDPTSDINFSLDIDESNDSIFNKGNSTPNIKANNKKQITKTNTYKPYYEIDTKKSSKTDLLTLLKQKSLEDETAKSNFNKIKQEDFTLINREIEDKEIDLTTLDDIKIKELDQKDLKIEEGKEFFISLEATSWIIKSIRPELLKLLDRNNSPANTVFHFKANNPANIDITFLRYEKDNNEIWRQTCKVAVIPKDASNSQANKKEKANTKKQSTKTQKKETTDYRKDIANALFNQRKYDEARERYLALVNEQKGDSEVYYKLGFIEKQAGNADKAIEYLKNVIADKESVYFIDALVELIKILKDKNKYSQAIDTFFNYGLTTDLDDKSSEELYILLADIYFGMKDYANAVNEYRRFMQRYPQSKYYDKALFYLAYATESLENNPDFTEAYRLYKLLTTTYPESKFYNPSKNRMLYLERHYLKIN